MSESAVTCRCGWNLRPLRRARDRLRRGWNCPNCGRFVSDQEVVDPVSCLLAAAFHPHTKKER